MAGLILLACLQINQASLSVVDEQGKTHDVSAADLAKMPRHKVKATAEYEGVHFADLLQHCGVTLGKELRGPRVANIVLLEAEDGYRVTLSIGEVDPATTDKVVLLADRKDGASLPEKEGPFRLVIPDEKRPVRWIRMIKRISVQSPAKSN
jgi:hypothetical protein